MRNHTCLHFQQNIKLRAYLVTHYYCMNICPVKDAIVILNFRQNSFNSCETITVGFTGLEQLHQYILSGLKRPVERSHDVTSGKRPVLSGFQFCFKKFLLHQQIRREISRGVFRAIFDLRPHLMVDIIDFERFVTRMTDKDATVKDT